MNRERFDPLMEKYLAGTLSAAERAELRALLADDPAGRGEFIGLVTQEAALRTLYRELPTPARPPRRLTWVRWSAALAAGVFVAVALWLWNRAPADAELARLEVVEGEVYVLANAARLPARAGQRLLAGQGVEITGEDARAVMRFADDSRLELGAGTAYASRAESADQVILSQDCLVFAEAARPMLLVTPQAEVRLPEGRLSLSNALDATHVEVQSGAGAELVRKSDGQVVAVHSGFSALLTPLMEALVVEPAPPALEQPRRILGELPGYAAALAFAGPTLAVGCGDGTVRLWNLEDGQAPVVLGGPGSRVRGLAFSPDGRRLAVTNNVGDLEIHDLSAGTSRQVRAAHPGQIYALAFQADGQTLVTAGKDGQVIQWDSSSAERRRTLTGITRSTRSATFAPDLRTLATGDWHNLAKLWDADTGRPQATLRPDHDAEGGLFALAFSPDGALLAAASSNGAILLWDLEARRLRTTLFGHKGKIDSLAFTPDGQTLASAGRDHTVRLWNMSTGKEQAAIHGGNKINFNAVAFSPDGQTLATGESNRQVRLWDVPR